MAKRAKSGNTSCSLSGELTIYAVREQIKILREFLKKNPSHIELDLSEITEMDTAGLQLLLWLNKTCQDLNASWMLSKKSDSVSYFLEFSRCSKIGGAEIVQEGN